MCIRVSMCIVVDVFDVGAMQLFRSDLDVVEHEVGLLSRIYIDGSGCGGCS